MVMAHSNPNLVPEVITDRNGKRTTVHRRRSSVPMKQRPLLVPAPDSTKADEAIPFLRDALFNGQPTSGQEAALGNTFSLSPELEELSVRLLSRGTATGQRLVRGILLDTVNGLAASYERSGTAPRASRSSGLVNGRIIRAWSYGNIREEAELSPELISDEDMETLQFVHSTYTSEVTPYDEIKEEDHRTMSAEVERYWRGMSALSIPMGDGTIDEGMWDFAGNFIYWAADHEDIGKVISAAVAHQNVKPWELQKIMDATDAGVPNSLTDGWI